MEFESLIRSHIPHNIWQLNGQVPQTIMTGQTADISQLYELAWYEFCLWHDSTVSFPDDKICLGRYLGPAIDVGPAMTANIALRLMERGYLRDCTVNCLLLWTHFMP